MDARLTILLEETLKKHQVQGNLKKIVDDIFDVFREGEYFLIDEEAFIDFCAKFWDKIARNKLEDIMIFLEEADYRDVCRS